MPADQDAREVIRTRFDQTLFVQAGAGTGKTTALVARVVHLVATGHLTDMSHLAAITFTENAAAELRNRIRQALQPDEHGRYAGLDYPAADAAARLANGAAHLDDAVLTTLHGFASRILSEAPLEAGLPPDFTVTAGSGDPAERSWDEFIDNLLEDHPVRENLLCGLTFGLQLADLRTVATQLSSSWDRLRTRPLKVIPVPPISAAAVLTALRTAMAGEGRWPDDALAAHLHGTVRDLVDELTGGGDPLDLLDTLARADTIKCNLGKAHDWTKAGLNKPAVVRALKQAAAAASEMIGQVGAAVTESLSARIQDWLLTDSVRRRDAGTLEYHDLLVLARDVLRGDPQVRRRLHEKWPTLLIDEFQDTDPLQVEIACLLAGTCGEEDPGDWDSIAVAGGRLFFVGDAKQSIYRFRRADIDLFSKVGAKFVPADLRVNFRSVPGILQVANAAFQALIGDDPQAGIPFTPLDFSRDAAADTSPVLLLGGPQPGASAAVLRQQECAHLADVAVRAKHEQWAVGAGARASYRDIAILLPTRTTLPALEEALQDRGVPYRIESRSLVWSTDAVRGLIAVLQAIDNPIDEVALLASLRNPGLACSDVDLVTWRAAGGGWSVFADLPATLAAEHPVAAALATLRAWHDGRWWLPVNQLVETVVRDLRLVELTTSQRRPRDHWRRLRFVVDQARSWCDDGGSGLGGFVAWAVRQMDDDADLLETVVPEPDDDAVRILTVHGAKGLEFPITILAGLAGGTGRQPCVLWTDDGPQIRFRAGTLQTGGWDAAVGVEKEQARREMIRLLYVAVTRAMDHLVIGCYHAPPKGQTSLRSSAQQLWELISPGGFARIEIDIPDGALEPAPSSLSALVALPDRDVFADDRRALLESVRRRVATSPTALIAAVEPADEAGEVYVAAGDLGEHAVTATTSPARRIVHRLSDRGAAIGTATHRVLELVNLKHPGVQEVRALARLACAEQKIPELRADIEGRVWSALHSHTLREALDGDPRTLSEVYLVAGDGERFLEGYIDLLTDAGPGNLSIWDYKTDRATSAVEIAAKQRHYAPQLAAYARAVEQITGRPVASTSLVFAQPGPGLTESSALQCGPAVEQAAPIRAAVDTDLTH